MSNRIIYLFTLLCLTSLQAENAVSRKIKSWLTDAFGINAQEVYTGTQFHPTLENLNTVILREQQEAPAEDLIHGVSELAHLINSKELPEEAYLMLSDVADHKSYWKVARGFESLAQDETVFVYSRGYAGAEKPASDNKKKRGMCEIPKHGGGVVVGSQWLKNGVVHGSCVMFDYPDTRDYFDFGLRNDQECLDMIHAALAARTENIVFFGNCRGSKALLHYLSKSKPQAVKAVVLEAPFLDLERFTREIGKSYGKCIPFSNKIAKKIITKWYPLYQKSQDITLEDIKQIPVQIPLFIAHLKNDTLVADTMIKEMVRTLRDSGHTVYLLVIDDKTKSHSRLYQTAPFTKAVNAFWQKLGLPHDAALAQEGKKLLSDAYYNVQFIDTWKRGFAHVCKA